MTDEALCGLLCVCLSVLLCSFFSFRFSLRTFCIVVVKERKRERAESRIVADAIDRKEKKKNRKKEKVVSGK